ncbi:acyl-CoA desaturase [Lacihabitans lacunae]|jgi:stearoyl-CoA desaturase (Delta-9 desaturase)|uniref:Acyl-CoA desaturase n=1 Tax=Lacihabitans lacunae TaxID=1028214 RepID=A0ABV7Z336_9BACT
MAILIFFVAHWYLSLFAQTFFLHRYSAHKMFTMGPITEKVFYWLTFIFQGSSFLSPYAYGVMHRLHHAHADTAEDPHSPSFSKNLFDMMWKTKNYYQEIVNKVDHIEAKFKKNVPNWAFMEKLGDSWVSRLGWGVAYIMFYYYFAESYWVFLLLPIHFLMGPVHGVIINWFAHKYGYRNYDVDDTAKNLLPIDFLMMGESYHNNHHKFGGRANFGIKWHEFDPTYPVIKLLSFLKIIKLKPNNDLNYM